MSDVDQDEPIRINFTGVEGRKAFFLIPNGRYIVEITDWTDEEVTGEDSENKGARMINWEFTVESTEDGEEEITSRVRDPKTKKSSEETIKVKGRRVFDRMVMVEGSYWRIKAFLDACWYNTDGEIEMYPDQMMGDRFIAQIGQQPAKKNRKTGEQYNARNKVNDFFPLEEERPIEEPTPEPEPAKSKAKATKETAEEVKV